MFIHYYAAIGIDRFRLNQVMTKIILIAAVAVSLLVLAYFKYSGFLLDLINSLANKKQSLSTYQVILPVAISFYCFQSISYSVDVFRNHVAVEKRFLRLFLYIGFFPQLVAGPIARASQLLYQFNRIRKPRLSVFLFETYLIIRGFFLKMVVADNLGIVVDKYWPLLSNENALLKQELGTPFINPKLDNITTADSSHLQRESAARLSAEFWRQFMELLGVRERLARP